MCVFDSLDSYVEVICACDNCLVNGETVWYSVAWVLLLSTVDVICVDDGR